MLHYTITIKLFSYIYKNIRQIICVYERKWLNLHYHITEAGIPFQGAWRSATLPVYASWGPTPMAIAK